MKKLISGTEVEGEGLVSLLGEYVTVWCLNYTYSGRLVGVNTTDIQLEEAEIVFNTGSLCDKAFETSERLPGACHYVRTAAIESYGKRAF